MAPRENYFFYILNEVKSLFDSYAPQDKLESYDEMWFEFNKIPLKWQNIFLTSSSRNVPIGVQFDSIIGIKQKQKDLPWCLVFHYKGCPEEQVLKLEGMNFFRFHYINSLKESQSLRVGSANDILSSLSKKDENKMIEGLIKHNYESFWEINQPLCDKPLTEMKKYAIRVFTNRHHTYVQINQDIKQKEGEEDSAKLTIGDVLEAAFPRLFEKSLGERGELEVTKKRNFEVIIQGVEVNMETPVYWMQLNMSCLDNFVYLSFHFI